MNSNTFTKLQTFFGSWFNQGWTCEGDDWTVIVNSFKCASTSTEATEVAEAIEKMLADFTTDEELHYQIYEQMYCYYDPRPDLGEPSLANWLREVVEALRKETQKESHNQKNAPNQ